MTTICDTGPLVAYLNRRDPYHAWALTLMKQVRPPMLTSEPVLTEATGITNEHWGIFHETNRRVDSVACFLIAGVRRRSGSRFFKLETGETKFEN